MTMRLTIPAALLALAAGLAGQAAPQPAERDVYVTVLDKAGTPIVGLTAEYFAVREDGKDREVVRVLPSAGPATVAVLIDTSAFVENAFEPYRAAIGAFVSRVAPGNQVGLYEFGERARVLVAFTGDTAQLQEGIARLTVRANTTPRLLDTVDAACRDLTAARAARPVIVAVTASAADSSTRSAGGVIKSLIEQGISLHVTGVSGRSGPEIPSLTSTSGKSEVDRRERLNQLRSAGEGDREHARLLEEGTGKTAGSLHMVASALAIGPVLDQVAAELSATYRLTFARPGTGKSKNLMVGLMLEDVVVRAIAAPAAPK